ncbi:MAG TPA: CoA transferase [Solirubrobacterales bacterium]|nr:CoA transferase [Solirubrobacterales bacterium]
MSGPLQGLRVVDMATVVAGPGIAKHLADFGADVIKVESPQGDPTRRLGWKRDGDEDSLFWKALGRGKRTRTLDLKTAAGLEEMEAILAAADVLVENMRPGKLERLGLAPESLHARNPSLVIVRVTGFGQDGPYASFPGFATIAEAMSGYANLCGMPEGPPLLPPVALTDEITALAGAFATMAAVHHASASGQGQVVDVNLLETMLHMLGPLPSAFLHLGYEQPRMGSGMPYTVPRGTYRCADGAWVALSSTADSVAERVLGLLGLGEDPRFASFDGRAEHREEIERLVGEFIAARPSEEVLRRFREVDAAITVVYTVAEVTADEHVNARGAFEMVDGIWMQRPIARLSRTPADIRFAGRPLGADDERIRTRPWEER